MAAPAAAGAAVAVAEAPAPAAAAEEDEGLAMEPYIESAQCTTCDECTKINNKMFAYNDKKLAYIKDPRAGTFKQLVQAAEKCTVRIIHPGTPLNPKEKDLNKWIKRAEPFN
jgi:pyruvate-ferredoxin/flavodoxin oxidoreductase